MNIITQRTGIFVILSIAIASTGCGQTGSSGEPTKAASLADIFDPLSLPKDSLPREPFLDPTSFYSTQAYLIQARVGNAAQVATDAAYVGGKDQMVSYIKEKVLGFIPPGIGWLKPPTVNFTVNEHGRTTDVVLVRGSGNVDLDRLLVQLFVDMPEWVPATDAHGRSVDQFFAFTVGNGGC